jgi:ribosomal protein S18 acetylase RimI-like enzyme
MVCAANITDQGGELMLTHTSQLTAQQLIELDTLCQHCKRVDGNTIALYQHILSQNRPFACNIFYHKKQTLVGFLSTFYFYENTCEISVMVAPNWRNKGIATQMIRESLAHISTQEIEKLVFSTPNGANAAWLSAHGCHYQHSEYQMQQQGVTPPITTDDTFIVRPATLDDLRTIVAIDEACFSLPAAERLLRLHDLFSDPSYSILIALKDGIPIGKAHIHYQNNTARLTDIAIFPHQQGQGFGSRLLMWCLDICQKDQRKSVNLDVETSNHNALNLYIRMGFVVINSYDFWAIPTRQLSQLI